MKKFLSMVMAAAMVVSLVPATAFAAAGDFKATAKVVDAKNFAVDEIESGDSVGGSELQLTLTTADTLKGKDSLKFTLNFDNVVDFKGSELDKNAIYVKDGSEVATGKFDITVNKTDDTEFEVTVAEKDSNVDAYARGQVIGIPLDNVCIDKVSKGKTATVSVDSDDATVTNGDDLVFASVESKGIKASVKDTVDVATEEVAEIKELKIEPAVGDTLGAVAKNGTDIRLKLNSGFEFVKSDLTLSTDKGTPVPDVAWDDDEVTFENIGDGITGAEWFKIAGLKVEATSAKSGSTATIKVYVDGNDTVSVEVAKVVDYTVSMCPLMKTKTYL